MSERLKNLYYSLFLPLPPNPEAPPAQLMPCPPAGEWESGHDEWQGHRIMASLPTPLEPGWQEGRLPDRGAGIPRSSPARQRCVCWGSVPGEQGSEAEGKGSFGFHGRPAGEKMPLIGFKAPRAQHPTPLPVASSLHTLRNRGQNRHSSRPWLSRTSWRTRLALDQAWKEYLNRQSNA